MFDEDGDGREREPAARKEGFVGENASEEMIPTEGGGIMDRTWEQVL